jgi:hypothetical protein
MRLISRLLDHSITLMADCHSVGPYHTATGRSGFAVCDLQGVVLETPHALRAAARFLKLAGPQGVRRALLRKFNLVGGP